MDWGRLPEGEGTVGWEASAPEVKAALTAPKVGRSSFEGRVSGRFLSNDEGSGAGKGRVDFARPSTGERVQGAWDGRGRVRP